MSSTSSGAARVAAGVSAGAHKEDFAGRLAFVTGAASGIGRAIAEELARRGMRVVFADIDGAQARAAAACWPDCMALELDVRDPAGWTEALDAAERAFGPLAVLVCNAGVAGSHQPLAQTSAAAWEWTRSINLDGVFHGLSQGVPRLLATGLPGHVVATASLGAMLVWPGNGVYSAAKAGVVALCEALRGELAATRANVSVLLPGLVRTALVEANAARAPHGVVGADLGPELAEAIRGGLDPETVGRMVADAIGTERFWLFTHPDLRDPVLARNEEIRQALG